MSEWIETTVGEYCEFKYGKALPQNKRLRGYYSVYGSNGVIGTHNEFYVEKYGVIIGRKGSVGEVHLSLKPFWVIDTAFYVTKESLDELKFTYFLLKTLGLDKMNSDSAVPGLNRNNAHSLKIKIPKDVKDREYLGRQLYFFNDKIHLNTQTNQTLETIAQAIFKHWFIDFAPVHAKAGALAEGKTAEQAELAAMASISGKTEAEITALAQTNPQAYQQLQQTAAAFPSEFVESELGLVPKGWEVKPLAEVFDFLEGPGIRNWQYTENKDGIKFINIRCINNNDLSLNTANKITKEEAFGKYKHFQLAENDIVISTSGTLGKTAIVRKEHLPLCLNTSVIRFRAIENISTFQFLKGFVENQLQNELETRASGSVQRNFGPTHLKQIRLIIPNFELLKHHQHFTNNLFNKRTNNLSENDILIQTRDTLLPKLLNGEVEL